jgi:hypothetical protein
MNELGIFNSAAELRSRGYTLRDAPFNIVGYDPAGDGKDRDSLVLVSREEWRRGELWDPDLSVEFIFRVLLAHRMAPDLELPDKLAQLLALNRQLLAWKTEGKSAGHAFTVETNGIGYGVHQGMREKISSPVIGYTTIGSVSDKAHHTHKITMPRLPALDLLRALMELHRLKSVRGAPGIDVLIQELNAFVWRKPGRPEAMIGAHDDLVLALAGAIWIGSKIIPPMTKQKKFPGEPGRGITHRTSSGRMRLS